MALQQQKKSNFTKSGQNPRSQIHPNLNEINKCTGCKKEGHTHENCWFLHPHLKPKHWKNQSPVQRGRGDRSEGRERNEGQGHVYFTESKNTAEPKAIALEQAPINYINGSATTNRLGAYSFNRPPATNGSNSFNWPTATNGAGASFFSGGSGSGRNGSEAADQL